MFYYTKNIYSHFPELLPTSFLDKNLSILICPVFSKSTLIKLFPKGTSPAFFEKSSDLHLSAHCVQFLILS